MPSTVTVTPPIPHDPGTRLLAAGRIGPVGDGRRYREVRTDGHPYLPIPGVTTTSSTVPYAPREAWAPLPESARWDRAEGAFLVDGTPVAVEGDRYRVEPS